MFYPTCDIHTYTEQWKEESRASHVCSQRVRLDLKENMDLERLQVLAITFLQFFCRHLTF